MSAPQRFRKKPVEIDAMQYDGTVARATEIIDWALSAGGTITYHCPDDGTCDRDSHVLAVRTLEGTMTALPGDWIIRGVQGEFYPCKPDIFAETYSFVDETGRAAGGPIPRLTTTAALRVRVIPEGDPYDGPVLGTVAVVAPPENVDEVCEIINRALRIGKVGLS